MRAAAILIGAIYPAAHAAEAETLPDRHHETVCKGDILDNRGPAGITVGACDLIHVADTMPTACKIIIAVCGDPQPYAKMGYVLKNKPFSVDADVDDINLSILVPFSVSNGKRTEKIPQAN